jgi:DNA-binding MarR family transcriptional regulator
MKRDTDPVVVATELREVLGRLARRLRAEQGTLSFAAGVVLGRLDREGPQSVSDLAASERVRPQSMAQTVKELECDGLVERRPDPNDGRRALVELTESGLETLRAARQRREGWLARAIEQDLTAEEQAALTEAVELLRRLGES